MKIRIILPIALIVGLMSSCGQTTVNLKSGIDTPKQHVENGMRLLEAGKPEDAHQEFNRAKELNATYPPAYVGLGLVSGIQGDVEKGLLIIKEAIELMRNQTASIQPAGGDEIAP